MDDILNLKANTIISDSYESELNLPSWIGFQSRQGYYTFVDEKQVSDGLVKIFVQGKDINGVSLVTQAQVNAINYLIENTDLVRDNLLIGLLNEMPKLSEIYEDLLPQIDKIEDFKNYIGLANLHLIASDKDGFAYIGFELGCEWDEEHGLGIMMHKDRVVAIGQADTAFDSWITFDDNGTAAIEIKKLEAAKQVKNKKSWWQFWK